MWRHTSILYGLTPTNETLQTLPTTVGVPVGVAGIGQVEFGDRFGQPLSTVVTELRNIESIRVLPHQPFDLDIPPGSDPMDTEKHLYELIKHFRTAMVVTHAKDGSCHARPMAVAEIKPGADAYFATTIDLPKIAELEADPRILITFQSSSEFATLEGTATIVRDRVLIDRLWSEAWHSLVDHAHMPNADPPAFIKAHPGLCHSTDLARRRRTVE